MRTLLLSSMLLAAVAAQGMFDLVPGRWTGPVQGLELSLEIGPPDEKLMVWSIRRPDRTPVKVRGHYKVTSAKRPTFAEFRIVEVDGSTEAILQGVRLAAGRSVRIGLDHPEADTLQLDVFHEDLSHAFRADLKKQP